MKRRTKEQKAAYEHYCFCERQEDRYMGSVFVTPAGAAAASARTTAAYQTCKLLGMGVEHGL